MSMFALLALLAAPPALTTEPNVDRPGSDYRGIDLKKADPELCKQACADDSKCKAYTFVKPGVQGKSARCWLKDAVPAPGPSDCCTSGVRVVAATANAAGLEPGIDRPGSDYKSLDLDRPEPTVCRDRCAEDLECRAFTFVKPGVQAPKARCWLKNAVPPPTKSDCCTSGVPPTVEPKTDRPGSDARDMDLPAPNPGLCRKACAADANCRAYTYVNPGVQGPSARCWLKNEAPAGEPNDCCTSGAKP